MKIRILAAGGTIDAGQYDFKEGKVISFADPAVSHILKDGRVRNIHTMPVEPITDTDADIFVLERKDSLDMTDEDRKRILQMCLLDTRDRILITHGTDTMTKTGELLEKNIKDKTIVLTGSMRPYTSSESDASFNLGGALIATETLPHGVYIVIQGEVFRVGEVQKIRTEGDPHFERK